MRTIITLLSVLLFSYSSTMAQNWEKNYPGRIETFSVNRSPYSKEPLSWKNQDKYFYFELGYARVYLSTIDEVNGNEKFKPEIDGFKKILSPYIMTLNNEVYLFFGSKISATGSKQNAFYVGRYDVGKNTFVDPKMIEEYGADTKFNFICKSSENKKYVAFIIDPKQSKKSYSFNLLILDSVLKKIVSLKETTCDFANLSEIYDVCISDQGDVNFLFTKEGQTFSKMTSFQGNGNFVYTYRYDLDKETAEKHEVIFEDRNVLHAKTLNHEQGNELFISWYKIEDAKTVGISKYNLVTREEEKLYEFDPDLLEPFLKVTSRTDSYAYKDFKERTNELSTTNINACVDLITYFQHDGIEFYLMKKSTPILNYDAQNNGSTKYQYLDGDIFLLNLTNKKIKKIERMVAHPRLSKGIYISKNESQLTLYYYSVPPDFDGEVRAKETLTLNTNKVYDDFHLYRTTVDLNTLDLSSEEIKVFEENMEPKRVYLSTIQFNSNNKVALAAKTDGYEIFEFKD